MTNPDPGTNPDPDPGTISNPNSGTEIKRQPTFTIIGSGALGGYYGARLVHAGYEVHFLLHSDYEYVKQHGLKVMSKEGDFSIAEPNVYADVKDMPPSDVVVVGLKSTSNHLLGELLPPVLKADGVVLVLQNGYGIEDEVAEIVGTERVAGGLAFLCSNKVGPGHINHLDYGQIRFADYAPDQAIRGKTERIVNLAACFEQAGIPTVVEDDLVLARWKKLVWNIPYNGLSVVLQATTDKIMQNPETRELCYQLMKEVSLAAGAYGRTIDEDFIQHMMTNTDKMVAYKPSMLLDYEARRPLEIQAIFNAPLQAAKAKGVELPRIEMLAKQLAFFDTHRNNE